ncbi:MAG: hypothetical protein NVSMB9_08750 [Isosphaeraceae bacterium]
MSWYTRFWNYFRDPLRVHRPVRDPEATADVPDSSQLVLYSGTLRLRAGVVSTVGNYREHNEDNYYVPGRISNANDGSMSGSGETPVSEHELNDPFIVADGMGGQQAGEEASRMAVEIIPKAIARRLPQDVTDPKLIQAAIRDSVAEANKEILGSSGTVTEYSNMGTTVVLSLFRKDRVYVAGIGDSRAYRLRQGRLEQLTKDHSLADALGEAGTITKEEIPNHKFKNILYLYLGSKDARGGPEDVRVLDVLPMDRFLLASDGLTGVVSDEQIARILATCDNPQRAAKVLTDEALANDSRDNVTCLVIHVVGDDSHTRPPAT